MGITPDNNRYNAQFQFEPQYSKIAPVRICKDEQDSLQQILTGAHLKYRMFRVYNVAGIHS